DAGAREAQRLWAAQRAAAPAVRRTILPPSPNHSSKPSRISAGKKEYRRCKCNGYWRPDVSWHSCWARRLWQMRNDLVSAPSQAIPASHSVLATFNWTADRTLPVIKQSPQPFRCSQAPPSALICARPQWTRRVVWANVLTGPIAAVLLA